MTRCLNVLKQTLIRVEGAACAGLLFAMMTVITWGMLERYILKSGLGWTDELSRYLSIWAVFLGGSLGVVKGAHVGVDVFVRLLPRRFAKSADRVANAAGALFTGLVAWIGAGYFMRLLGTGQITPAMQFPLAWAFLAVPVGCAFMCLHCLLEIAVPRESGGEDNG